MYQTLYKSARKALRPLHRKAALDRALIRGLGRGGSNRIGRCLFSFVTDYIQHVTEQFSPAVWNRDDIGRVLENSIQGRFTTHQLHWESAELLRQLIARGFIVDCIYDRDGGLLEDVSGYDLILDEWFNLPRWAECNSKAKKWFYATSSHWLYSNTAEMQRLNWLFHRRGVALEPQFILPPLLGPACADVVSYKGSDFTLATYGAYLPKMRRLISASATVQTAFQNKNWSVAKRRFLFFGSKGWVHRGLDLVIEAFLQTDLELIVSAKLDGVLEIYGEDLRRHANIQCVGFIEPGSEAFRRIIDTTCAVVYPSAAEGCSGAVVQCMQFGLIPVITEAVGLDVPVICRPVAGRTDQELISDILARCSMLSQSSDQQLQEWSHASWNYAAQTHTRPAYRASLNAVLDELLV